MESRERTKTGTRRRRFLLLVIFLALGQEHSCTALRLLPPRNARRRQQQQEALQAETTTKKSIVQNQSPSQQPSSQNNNTTAVKNNLNALRARAGLLRTSIQKQQLELQQLEREIICCASSSTNAAGASSSSSSSPLSRAFDTFVTSASVLHRKLGRVQNKIGRSNQQWKSVEHYLSSQTVTGARIVRGLLSHQRSSLKYLVADPDTPALVPHIPAILARLDQLEPHVSRILEVVMNNKRHLASIEPHLDEILERFDDIEPHLPWILEHIDALAPYTGLLLEHIDELLLYADANDDANDDDDRYALASQLLPYLEYYVSRLDVIGPHLPLLRPHVPLLLKHNRIGNISPHIDRLFALGYQDLSASANMDVLLFWVGWTLRIPGLPKLFFKLPGSPRIVSLLANRLPKRFVRGYCRGVTCNVDNDYGQQWNSLRKE